MRLQLLYEATLLAAAGAIFVEFLDPLSAYLMVGFTLFVLAYEILDKLGILGKHRVRTVKSS
jgi:hypothetical protein